MDGRRAGRVLFASAGGVWLCALILLLPACGGPPARPRDPTAPPRSVVEARLRASIEPWIGTPHCIGGTGRRCIDCSGFVRNVFASTFSTELPRTAQEMRRSGTAIARGPLAPGDLLVYRISKRRLHVGIYLGHGEFAHSSSSQGVMISSTGERYWTRRFVEARRVI